MLSTRALPGPLQGGAERGFTLVELMIAIVVLGVLMGLGMPSFLAMMRNAEIKNAAESLVNGIQRARSEAVARNANVQFVMSAGNSWTVDYVTKPVSTDPVLDQRAGKEGASNVTTTALASDGTTAATRITFNNVGQVVANGDGSPALSRIDLSATGGTSLRVTVGAGGNARSCDPSLASGSSLRAC